MVPVLIEVIAPVLWGMDMSCRGCGLAFDAAGLKDKERKSALESYPEEWKEAADYLSQLIKHISHLYRHRIRISVIDAQSPLGLWKQIRYRVRKFPAFIIDRKETYVGWDNKELEAVIDQQIHKTS